MSAVCGGWLRCDRIRGEREEEFHGEWRATAARARAGSSVQGEPRRNLILDTTAFQ